MIRFILDSIFVHQKIPRVPRELENILIIDFDGIGDSLFVTPAIKALKFRYPSAKISVLSRAYNAPIFRQNPYIDEVLAAEESLLRMASIDKFPLLLFRIASKNKFLSLLFGIFRSIRYYTRFVLGMQRKKFDLGIIFEANERFNRLGSVLLYLFGIRYRIVKVIDEYEVFEDGHPLKHWVDRYLELVSRVGATTDDKNLILETLEKDNEYIEGFLVKNKVLTNDNLVVICPGSIKYWVERAWPIERFKEVAERLTKEERIKVIITGTKMEGKTYEEIFEHKNPNIILACGETTIGQLASLLKKAHLFITNDTGPLHIANAVGTPHIIALYGSTDPNCTKPQNHRCQIIKKEISCSPCFEASNRTSQCPEGKENLCFKLISVDEVVKIALEKIQKTK